MTNAFSTHSRTASDDTRSSGASYHLILEHILAYPGSYEIPLRTMYTLNCAPRAQPLPAHLSRPSSPSPASPTHSTFQEASSASATAQFTSSLMNQISQLPQQPCSLPPAFITSFVRRCFVPQLELVDFPQALTGLDYLKDLEMRRRREMASTLGRLGVDRSTLGSDPEELTKKSPKVASWVKSIESSERKVEALYTQLYVAIRRWIMINELMIRPFNKQNCVAMLNTLYPPVCPAQPTAALTPQVMKTQRDGFFKYIQAIGRSGDTAILDTLMQQGKRNEDQNGWPAVRETLDRYLRMANLLIEESSKIHSPEDLNVDQGDDGNVDGKRKDRKADSGVSFASHDRHSAAASTVSNASVADKDKPLPTTPATATLPAANAPAPITPRSYSTLEKITMELRRIRLRHNKSDDPPEKENHEPSRSKDSESPNTGGLHAPKKVKSRSRSGSLRKLKSLGDLRSSSRASSSHGSSGGNDIPAFELDETRRARLLSEANASKNGGAQKLGSAFEI